MIQCENNNCHYWITVERDRDVISVDYLNGDTAEGYFCDNCIKEIRKKCLPVTGEFSQPIPIHVKFLRPLPLDFVHFPIVISQIIIDYYQSEGMSTHFTTVHHEAFISLFTALYQSREASFDTQKWFPPEEFYLKFIQRAQSRERFVDHWIEFPPFDPSARFVADQCHKNINQLSKKRKELERELTDLKRKRNRIESEMGAIDERLSVSVDILHQWGYCLQVRQGNAELVKLSQIQ